MTDHLKDYAPDLEKYIKRCRIFPCGKIEMRRIAIFFFGNFILKIEIIMIF